MQEGENASGIPEAFENIWRCWCVIPGSAIFLDCDKGVFQIGDLHTNCL